MKSSTILSLGGVAVITLVIGTTLGSIYFPVTKTVTTEKTSATTITLLIGDTQSRAQTVTSTISLAIPCSNVYPNGTAPPDAPSLGIQENATAFLCVRFYYYNSSSIMSVNASSIISLIGYKSENSPGPSYFDPSSNFTIAVFPSELSLGGPQNLNEGTPVLYAVHANSNSKGSYTFALLATLYPTMEDCAQFSKIIVGSGLPDYVEYGSCTASPTYRFPVNSQGFINGFLFAQVVDMANSSS